MQSLVGLFHVNRNQHQTETAYLTSCLPAWRQSVTKQSYTYSCFSAHAQGTTHQPITQLGNLVLIGGGRIDNKEEIYRHLPSIRPLSKLDLADSKLILQTYATLGTKCLPLLRGSFAFAIYDTAKEHLFLACDHLGTQPIHYCLEPGGRFSFASYVGLIAQLPGFSTQFNAEKLVEFSLLMFPDTASTFYQNIYTLPKGSFLEISTASPHPKIHTYYKLSYRKDDAVKRPEEAVEAFKPLFTNAVSRCMQGYRNIGCHLSGGLDSSSVAMVASQILQADNRTLTAFGLVPSYDTSRSKRNNWLPNDIEAISAVAQGAPNISLHAVRLPDDGFSTGVESFYHLSQGPLLNPCNRLWIEHINQLAQSHNLSLLLTGAMGNMTISQAGQPADFLRWLRRVKQYVFYKLHGLKIRYTLETEYDDLSYIRPQYKRTSAMAKSFVTSRLIPPWNPTYLMLEYGTPSIDCYQTYEALFGVKMADPTYDLDVVEFCVKQPNFVFSRAQGRRLLIRDAMQGILPDNVRLRTQRGMQLADWYHRFDRQVPLFHDKLKAFYKNPLVNTYFDIAGMQNQLHQWPSHELAYADFEYRYRFSWLRSFFLANYTDWFYRTHLS